MPHTGGLEMLGICFGAQTRPAAYTVLFYAGAAGQTIVFDDMDALDKPLGLIDLSDYPASLDSLSAVSFDNATLDALITVVNGVPQIEFPEVLAVFSGALSSGDSLYGYAVCSANSVMFRELFESPIVPGNGEVLRMIPTFRIGNTKNNLT